MGNYAFIHMNTEHEAETAIRSLNNFTFRGSSLNVQLATGERKRGGMRRVGGGRGGYGGTPMRGEGPRSTPYDRPPQDYGRRDDYQRQDFSQGGVNLSNIISII